MYLKNGNGALFGGVRVLHGGDDDPLRGAHLGPVLEPGEGRGWLPPHLDLEGRHPVELHHPGAAAALVYGRGQILVSAEVRLGLLAGVGLPCLGHCYHTELILLAQTENRKLLVNPGLDKSNFWLLQF